MVNYIRQILCLQNIISNNASEILPIQYNILILYIKMYKAHVSNFKTQLNFHIAIKYRDYELL